jgi:hypothetical protein
VEQEPFNRDSFFRSDPVQLYVDYDFTDWVLNALPDEVPAFKGNITVTELTEVMHDSDIPTRLGIRPFSPVEFAAVIRNLFVGQSRGQNGILLTNNQSNIFYIKLRDGRVVALSVHFGRPPNRDRAWGWFVDGTPFDHRYVGDCVFSPS